jgi:hypothetical protein
VPSPTPTPNNTGAIVGGVVGGIAGIVIIGLLVWILLPWLKRSLNNDQSNVPQRDDRRPAFLGPTELEGGSKNPPTQEIDLEQVGGRLRYPAGL